MAPNTLRCRPAYRLVSKVCSRIDCVLADHPIQRFTPLARLFAVLAIATTLLLPSAAFSQVKVIAKDVELGEVKERIEASAQSRNSTITQSLRVADRFGDDGTALNVEVALSSDISQVDLRICEREDGLYRLVETLKLSDGTGEALVTGLTPGIEVWLAVFDGDDEPAFTARGTPTREVFDANRTYLLLVGLLVTGSILGFIYAARRGVPMWVRPIPALSAVDEAVGRATEMGKDVLFVPGIQDINDIQTIAGLTILGHVAERTADYRASLEVPTSKSLVMTAASETVETAYLEAGRHDYFNADSVSYITDEQFGYVAYLSGYMVREKPAACFYLGAFFAESLLLAETGNAVGAVQVAGTAQPSQLPFFVAACDYTLIGEEFFAASAYLSGDADELGSLKGQDVGKVFVGVAVLIGVGLLTAAAVTGDASIEYAADYWKNIILSGG